MNEREIVLPLQDIALGATLNVPANARGVVIFAHGSGSSRHSPRNRFVARSLNSASLATLLLDLLTEDEEEVDTATATLRFDIPLLARRVALATDWSRENEQLQSLHVGYFGASTGAGAALLAASTREDVAAVVSRGGRPDLAGDALHGVTAATLLIVGANDRHVLELNRQAAAQMTSRCEVAVIPNAGHLFQEPAALEAVSRLAQEWFLRYLPA